jgi:hypothetical protein
MINSYSFQKVLRFLFRTCEAMGNESNKQNLGFFYMYVCVYHIIFVLIFIIN